MAAQHRLILSGTPIQNSVLELWALFDFLMPGFLGGQAAFSARFGKAVAASRGASLGSAEAQAGLLAMDGLHKQARLSAPAHPKNMLPGISGMRGAVRPQGAANSAGTSRGAACTAEGRSNVEGATSSAPASCICMQADVPHAGAR